MVRAASESHADTRLFYIVHKAFRLGTNRLVDGTEKLPPSVLQPLIGSVWSFYAGVLDHHHHTEDTSILPALVALRPDLEALVNDLANDHRRLIVAIDAVNAAVTAFEQQPDVARQRTLHEAIVSVREEFFPHLDVEDAKIIHDYRVNAARRVGTPRRAGTENNAQAIFAACSGCAGRGHPKLA